MTGKLESVTKLLSLHGSAEPIFGQNDQNKVFGYNLNRVPNFIEIGIKNSELLAKPLCPNLVMRDHLNSFHPSVSLILIFLNEANFIKDYAYTTHFQGLFLARRKNYQVTWVFTVLQP